MLSLPIAFRSALGGFAPVWSRPVGQPVTVLLTGAVLAPGQRTVTAILRIRGHSASSDFQTYHRGRNRAVWSPLTASRRLLRLLVAVCIPQGVVVCGLAAPIERRRGAPMPAQGIYRDPVRSSHTHFVKVSGRRGLCGRVLTPSAGAKRVWALPFLTVRCPSERFYAQRGRCHQPLTARAWQMIRLVGRWWPGRAIVWVADSRFAVLAVLAQVKTWPPTRAITRLRLDAALYDPPPLRVPGPTGRPRLQGQRRPTLEAMWADEKTPGTPLRVEHWYGERPRAVEVAPDTAVWYHTGHPPVAMRWVLIRDPQTCGKPQALVSTNLEPTVVPIWTWLVRRWTMEGTCEEARAHLGMETQRPWHDRAMARTPRRC